MREEIQIETLGPAISHYTDAVRFGDLLLISGVVAWDQEGNVVGKGDVVAQTEKIFNCMGHQSDGRATVRQLGRLYCSEKNFPEAFKRTHLQLTHALLR